MRAGFTALFISGAAVLTPAGFAQDSQRLGDYDDWAVFVEKPPTVSEKKCWLASAPTRIVNTRNGAPVEVRRDPSYLFILFVPSQNQNGEVSFVSGYPFPEGGSAQIQIGSARYDMYTEGERAYSPDARTDSKLHDSMKRGAEAIVTAVSARGTTTRDTFSLTGFTAAMNALKTQCPEAG